MKLILATIVILAMPFFQNATKKKVIFFGDSITQTMMGLLKTFLGSIS
ncbi:MAG: hypothetical protein WDO15_02035 [Bacteroidota bacterium]